MKYRVIWFPEALSELAEIHSAAFDQESVEHAAHRINLELAGNPLEAGESREPGRRVLFKFPLVAWFQVSVRMPEVLVYHVRGKTR